MRLLLPISVSLWLLAAQSAGAQPADAFFNTGAQFYISNNIAQAKGSVTNGLKLYPDDLKLKKLDELLKQQSQQQQSQQNQSQSQNQQSQQQQQQQNQKPAQKQDQQNQPAQDQSQQPKPPEPASQGQPNEKSGDQKGQSPEAAREMSPEEARRLLDAQKGDEQYLQLKPQSPPERENKPIKDW